MSQPDRDAGTPSSDTAPAEIATHDEMVVGFNAELGFRLTEWRQDYARLELTVAPKHLNRSGIVHGGVLATLIDAAGGYTGVWQPDPAADMIRAVTLSLTTSFVGQSRSGRLIATAHRKGGGKRIFFATGEVHDEAGTLLAFGEATYRVRGTVSGPD